MRGATLDAGALIAFERGDSRMLALLDRVSHDPESKIVIPAGVLAQVWRNGSRQARLSRLITSRQSIVNDLDEEQAKAVGILLGVSGTADAIDASVVICALQHSQVVITSDPEDLRVLAPRLAVQAI
jgi:hypothetical protein